MSHPQPEPGVRVRRFLQFVSGHAIAVTYGTIVDAPRDNNIALIHGIVIVFTYGNIVAVPFCHGVRHC